MPSVSEEARAEDDDARSGDAFGRPGADFGGAIIWNETFAPPTRIDPAGATSGSAPAFSGFAACALRRASRSAMNLLFRPAKGPEERCVGTGKAVPGAPLGGDGGTGGFDPTPRRSRTSFTTSRSSASGGIASWSWSSTERASPAPPPPEASASRIDAGSSPAVSSAVGAFGGAPPTRVARAAACALWSDDARNARWSSRSCSSVSAPRTRDNSAIATSRSRAGLRASLCDRVDVGGTEGTREPRPGSAEIIISFGGEIFAPRSRAGEPLSTRAARNRRSAIASPFVARRDRKPCS